MFEDNVSLCTGKVNYQDISGDVSTQVLIMLTVAQVQAAEISLQSPFTLHSYLSLVWPVKKWPFWENLTPIGLQKSCPLFLHFVAVVGQSPSHFLV
jgi:hypothetical protein